MLNKINISPDKQKLIVYLIIIVVTFAVFWRVNQYDFVSFDDPAYVTLNSHIQSGITWEGFRWAFNTKYTGLWNPLVWLSFMLDYQLHGLNAGGYHLTNLVLHVMSALLLFWLFNRMTGAIWRSAFVAAIFALHPLHVESVAWIAERKDVLSAFFWILTLCIYVYYTEKPVIRRYLPVLLCFACALMSKPMVITLPIVMILLDYWPLDRLQSNKKKLSEAKIAGIIPLWQLKEKIPFIVMSAVVLGSVFYNPSHPDILYKSAINLDASDFKQFPLVSRIANAPVAFVTYLEKTFWPHDMAIFYPFSDQLPLWQVLGASLLIIIISIAIIVMMKRLPYLFTGWMWFAITIAPVIGIIQISMTAPYAMADRYHYLPSIGLAVMMAWGVPDLLKRWKYHKEILLTSFSLIILYLAIITWTQVGYWQNSITLFDHALEVTDYNWLAYYNRGSAYGERGDYVQAIDDYSRAIEIKPDYWRAYDNRGVSYKKIGNYNQAIEDLNRAIEINPGYADAYNNRGNAYGYIGNEKQAIADYNRAIEIKPDYAQAYYNRGVAYHVLGNYSQAIEDLNRAIEVNPGYAEAYNNRGVVYAYLGKYSRAIDDWDRAIEIKPGYVDAYYNSGVAYIKSGNNNLAVSNLITAAKLGDERAMNFLKSQGISW